MICWQPLRWPELENPQPKLFMLGNEAVALGALTSGAKFMSAYPITPSSEIMEYMVKYAPAEGGVMLQTEDEISACTMAIAQLMPAPALLLRQQAQAYR